MNLLENRRIEILYNLQYSQFSLINILLRYNRGFFEGLFLNSYGMIFGFYVFKFLLSRKHMFVYKLKLLSFIIFLQT